jgi:hypothetical protein
MIGWRDVTPGTATSPRRRRAGRSDRVTSEQAAQFDELGFVLLDDLVPPEMLAPHDRRAHTHES